MAEQGWLGDSGLDSTNGTEFIQERVGLFAKALGLISLAFFVVGVVAVAGFGFPLGLHLTSRATMAHLGGLLLLGLVWLFCRRGTLAMPQLAMLDALTVVGACAAWSMFVDPQDAESVRSASVSVIMTVLARAIVVPSKSGRTLRLTALAAAPTLVMMALWTHAQIAAAPGASAPAWLTVIFQTLLLLVTTAMATFTSRIRVSV